MATPEANAGRFAAIRAALAKSKGMVDSASLMRKKRASAAAKQVDRSMAAKRAERGVADQQQKLMADKLQQQKKSY